MIFLYNIDKINLKKIKIQGMEIGKCRVTSI